MKTVLCCGIAVAFVLAGCDGSDDADVEPRGSIDPRFATAEALIDYYNSLPLDDPAAGADWLDLMYAETNLQRRLRHLDTLNVRMHHFDVLMFERFGESLREPGKGDYLIHRLGPTAVLVESDGPRAFADLTDGEHTARRALYLVKVGERWWISGYTFEYSMTESDTEELAQTIDVFELMVRAIPEIEPRLRAGDFETADETREAYKQALVAAVRGP